MGYYDFSRFEDFSNEELKEMHEALKAAVLDFQSEIAAKLMNEIEECNPKIFKESE